MEKTLYTPGLWTSFDATCLNDKKQIIGTYQITNGKEFGEGRLVIADVMPYGLGFTPEKQEAKANAHLIAAAPELLEALQRFIAFTDNVNKEHNDGFESSMVLQAKAAIAKALNTQPAASEEGGNSHD